MRVICTLPNASNLIGGKVFVSYEEDSTAFMVSEELEKADAGRLLSIPGYSIWNDKGEEVEAEIDARLEQFKNARVAEVVREESQKDATIQELQANLVDSGQKLAATKARIEELEAENAKLRARIGPPSMDWKKEELADYAESLGLTIASGDNKDEIIDAIEHRLKNEPSQSGGSGE